MFDKAKLAKILEAEGLKTSGYEASVGFLSATIGNDSRYGSHLKAVFVGGKVELRLRTWGAAGGMDGPGGIVRDQGKVVSKAANGKELAADIKIAISKDPTLSRYGGPKKWEWMFPFNIRRLGFRDPLTGVSAKKAQMAIDAYTLDRDAWEAKWVK